MGCVKMSSTCLRFRLWADLAFEGIPKTVLAVQCSRLQVFEHLSKWYKSLTADVFDLEHFEEAAAELRLEFLDRARCGAWELDAPAGAVIVPAGAAVLADNLPQQFSGMSIFDSRSNGKDELVAADAAAHRPVDLLESNHEIYDFRRVIRLSEFIHPTNDEAVVDE